MLILRLGFAAGFPILLMLDSYGIGAVVDNWKRARTTTAVEFSTFLELGMNTRETTNAQQRTRKSLIENPVCRSRLVSMFDTHHHRLENLLVPLQPLQCSPCDPESLAASTVSRTVPFLHKFNGALEVQMVLCPRVLFNTIEHCQSIRLTSLTWANTSVLPPTNSVVEKLPRSNWKLRMRDNPRQLV
jgi:hypothetical protein